MLHIHCGDCSAETLRQGGVMGEVIVWSDLLLEGPTPASASEEEWRRLRVQYLLKATGGGLTAVQLEKRLREQNEALEAYRDHDEAVLWFDACLYDQVILIRHLDWFGQRDLGDTTLSLLCVGAFPGFDRFAGLGELTAGQLASLLPARHPVTPAETELGAKAWAAFRSPDPTAVEAVVAGDCTALPYLREALVRHLQQYPSVRNGLNRLQNEALEGIANGLSALGPLFRETSTREERPFFGDTMLWNCLNGMAEGATPLVALQGPGLLPLWEPTDLERWTVTATKAGRSVLAGEEDWVKLNGIDRWLGGVRLYGDQAQWRWDEHAGKLVQG